MNFIPLPLHGAFIVEPEVYQDDRGSFCRFYCADEFREIGIDITWVQLNHSFTRTMGTLRGMHYQIAPYSEVKMVKCISGKVLDVIIDLRKKSPSFLHWTGVEISAENKRMIYIPEGFAHGFQTLTDNCEMIYHHSRAYEKDAEGAVRWNDPKFNIIWPMTPVHVSERDQNHPWVTEDFSGVNI
jgi:dTDP-4-dehydrorhamnose 3,5-epimerase